MLNQNQTPSCPRLLPCPICGSKEITAVQNPESGRFQRITIQCQSCGLTQTEQINPLDRMMGGEVAFKWNQRVPVAPEKPIPRPTYEDRRWLGEAGSVVAMSKDNLVSLFISDGEEVVAFPVNTDKKIYCEKLQTLINVCEKFISHLERS